MAKQRKIRGGVYRKTTLENGLRVVSEKLPAVRSVSLGVWVDTGSRHEAEREHGVSHLIEHMVFKGTRNRNARQIASSLESLGGSLNAFTSREQTCFTARIMDEHLTEAVDVLADIVCRASFTPTNLKREKLVICEEIKESIENPSDRIHDLFAETFWRGQPLGRPILGTFDSVLSMKRALVLGYMKRQYRAGSVVIAASGAIDHEELVTLAGEKFDFPEGEAVSGNHTAPPSAPILNAVPNETEQIHANLGYPGPSYRDQDRIAMLVLTTYLGSGMSSVLFQKVREKRGLAYTVFSYHDAYRDGGMFGTYFATDKNSLGMALKITLDEIRRMAKRRLSSERLEQIKEQLKGQLMIGMESTAARMNRLGRLELMLGRYVPLAKTLEQIDAVDRDKLIELARRVFDDNRLVVTALGPTEQKVLSEASQVG
jgi:predicted Zn-dependent peptidase